MVAATMSRRSVQRLSGVLAVGGSHALANVTACQSSSLLPKPPMLGKAACRRLFGALPQAVTKDDAGTTGPSKLSDVAKVSLLMQESASRVREIWLEYFKDKPRCFGGVMTGEEYFTLKTNMAKYPMCLLPLPRGSGYMNYVWQAQGDRILYKSVQAYQRGDSAGIDLSAVIFPDLLGTHQLALVHGNVHGLISKEEGARMVRFTREAYLDPGQFAWVRRFNDSPREFDFEEFIENFRPLEKWHNTAS
eukprot:TRINITY_DN69338_c0_g1_i1.p1 TRINITY_DN69338_c0_g1~~TRINITY_DN69338_c0_g1_i1.p1  ORF type:complete len:267 (-),score=31.13 TRINITY_DN69338_c0_g1_i1:50-793(-)